ncbi:MAG: SAF domain-containing protein [Brachybacterium sp.]|nr:SAF domain-containing protein [Brachybacterium sp.]
MSFTTNTKQNLGMTSEGLDVRAKLGQVTQKAPRRVGQWAASILFVVLVVVALVAVFQSQSDRVEVLTITNAVPPGQVIKEGDLRPVEVAGAPAAVLASDVESVIGKRSSSGLVEGQILTETAVTSELVPAEGQRVVSLSLSSGRVPGSLVAGDMVEVLAAPVEGAEGSKAQLQSPKVLAASARVESVGRSPEGTRVVTILVEESVADVVAVHSAAGQVTIVKAPVTAGEE